MAERYRQERAERLWAQQAREAREERERIAGAREEFEDRLARALGLGPSAFPGDADDAPRVAFRPLEGEAGEQGYGSTYGRDEVPRMAQRRRPRTKRPELLKAKWPADFLIRKTPELAPAKTAVPPESSPTDSASKPDAKETP